jgi:ppGpp synthetase/RelA/SpoT-type nucleotidyltranferase
VIVQVEDRPVEIQVRTTLQHLWAEISEKGSDSIPGLKYGRGPGWIQLLLMDFSQNVARVEELEARYVKIRRRLGSRDADVKDVRRDLRVIKQSMVAYFFKIA